MVEWWMTYVVQAWATSYCPKNSWWSGCLDWSRVHCMFDHHNFVCVSTNHSVCLRYSVEEEAFEAASLIIILRLWRVVRIVNGTYPILPGQRNLFMQAVWFPRCCAVFQGSVWPWLGTESGWGTQDHQSPPQGSRQDGWARGRQPHSTVLPDTNYAVDIMQEVIKAVHIVMYQAIFPKGVCVMSLDRCMCHCDLRFKGVSQLCHRHRMRRTIQP